MKMAVVCLMMEAASTSETSVNFYQTTRRYNPEVNHDSVQMMSVCDKIKRENTIIMHSLNKVHQVSVRMFCIQNTEWTSITFGTGSLQ
jgi:hypothetical protein